MTKLRAPLCVFGKHPEIHAQRQRSGVLGPSHAKLLANLGALLFADNYQPIRDEFREQSLNRQKQLRATPPVIAVKNVAVISVHKLAAARLADECSGCQPAIQETRGASDSARFGSVCVNDVGPLA